MRRVSKLCLVFRKSGLTKKLVLYLIFAMLIAYYLTISNYFYAKHNLPSLRDNLGSNVHFIERFNLLGAYLEELFVRISQETQQGNESQ